MRLLRRALVAAAAAAIPLVLWSAKPAAAVLCVQYGVSTDWSEPQMQTVYCDPNFDLPLSGTDTDNDRTQVGPLIVRYYAAYPSPV